MRLLAITILGLIMTIPMNAGEPAATAAEVRPAMVGTTVPDVTLQDKDGQDVKLAELVASKPTVMVFYRGGWCPFCNRQLAALGQSQAELAALGYQIVAISPDTPDKLQGTIDANGLSYTVLSDASGAAMGAFGIAFTHKERVLPVPTVYVFDTDGTIHFQYVNPNYKVRLDAGVLLAAAKAAAPKQ